MVLLIYSLNQFVPHWCRSSALITKNIHDINTRTGNIKRTQFDILPFVPWVRPGGVEAASNYYYRSQCTANKTAINHVCFLYQMSLYNRFSNLLLYLIHHSYAWKDLITCTCIALVVKDCYSKFSSDILWCSVNIICGYTIMPTRICTFFNLVQDKKYINQIIINNTLASQINY